MAKTILNGTYEVVTPGRVYIKDMGFVDIDESLTEEKALQILLLGHNHLIKNVKPEKPTTEK